MADIIDRKYIGSIAEIKTMTNTIICIGRIGEIHSDESMVIDSKSDDFPILDYNTIVKISVKNSKLGSIFLMGSVYASEYDMLTLQEITMIADTEKRNYFRVKHILEAKYYDKESGDPIDSFQLIDISLGGFMCRSAKELSEDQYYALELNIGLKRSFLEFKIVRKMDFKNGKYTYGCEFLNMNSKTQDDLAKMIFKIQRESISKIKNRF